MTGHVGGTGNRAKPLMVPGSVVTGSHLPNEAGHTLSRHGMVFCW